MKMTSAYANKMIRKLDEDKIYWLSRERENSAYVAATDEEPIIPDYDYDTVAKQIADIDEKIVRIKHAVNITNAVNEVEVNGNMMTIDTILIRMAQLNRRRDILDAMRKCEAKTRLSRTYHGSSNAVSEFRYLNYDLNHIREEYERIDRAVTAMQIALDKYNQTVEFEVDIDF